MDKEELIWRMNNIDVEEIETVNQLKEDFIEWCKWNKAYPKIETFESQEFYGEIIVVHNLFEDVKIGNGWEFLTDIQNILMDYAEHSEENCKYMIEFWTKKIKRCIE